MRRIRVLIWVVRRVAAAKLAGRRRCSVLSQDELARLAAFKAQYVGETC